MRRLVVSTVGTSVLTNGAPDDVRSWILRNANASDLPEDAPESWDSYRQARSDVLARAGVSERRKLSADLNALEALRLEHPTVHMDHYLVHTDTALGRMAADLVEQCLRTAYPSDSVSLISARGLQTRSLADFRVALEALMRDLMAIVADGANGRSAYHDRVFNLTGGFKSVNAFLQVLGMLYKCRCVFLFEGSSELLDIPSLPIVVDYEGVIRDHLTVFRRLHLGYPMTRAQAAGIPEAMLFILDDDVTLSAIGQKAFDECHKTLYEEDLLPLLSERVRVVDKVGRAVKRIHKAQLGEVNDALDAFCAYHDRSVPLGESRELKQLNTPEGPSTHQLYAWSTSGAGRLLGHYEDGNKAFVFDNLRKHAG